MSSRKSFRRRKKNLLLIVGFFVLIGSMVFYIWIYNTTNVLYREIDQLKRKEVSLIV